MDRSMDEHTVNDVISATEARVHLGAILDRLEREGGPIIVERGGRAQAVLLSLTAYERLSEAPASTDAKLMERARALRTRVKQRAGGPLPDPTTIIHDARNERNEDSPDLP
jgi:prevent-host-death family protein